MVVVLVVVSVVGFLFLDVAVSQVASEAGKTREMVVWKEVAQLPGDPAEWKADLDRILAVSWWFGARLTHNDPQYFECYLEVPVVYYDVLGNVLEGMGYHTAPPVMIYPLK
jgi:hypothetical protein